MRDALVVAGGAGTRLRPLTERTPKPLLPFCGRPFLSGVLARLAQVGVERVRLVVGADPTPFEVLRDDAAALAITLDAVPEPTPLDTAGGVRSVLDGLDDTFLVLNGDILTDVPLDRVVAAHRAASAVATLTLTRVEDTSSFGVCVLDGTRITAFVEKPRPGTLPGQDAVNAGTYVLEPAALARFPAGRPLSFERDVFPALVADGDHVEGFVSDAVWADLGTPERYRDGHRAALDGALRWPALDAVPADPSGVRVAPTATVAGTARLVGPVLVLDDASIASDAVVGPHVVLGPGAHVGAGAHVTGSVLDVAARVGDGVRADALVAGPGAEIAAGTDLGRDVVLGPRARVHGVVEDGARRGAT